MTPGRIERLEAAGEHTPGPWIFEPHGGFGSGISDTGSIVKATNQRCVDPFPFGYISTAHPSPIFALEPITSNGAEEMLANARLIAAAPRMFDYIAARASGGDAAATKIMESLHANP